MTVAGHLTPRRLGNAQAGLTEVFTAHRRFLWRWTVVAVMTLTCPLPCAFASDHAVQVADELAGSLPDNAPLAIYDPEPQHLLNRLFAALYIRESHIPAQRGQVPVHRIEGGDIIDFLAWPGSDYWSSPETCERISVLLDEYLTDPGRFRPADPVRRAVLLRDLWAAFDHYIGRNMARAGDRSVRARREGLCRKLAAAIRTLCLTSAEIGALPDTYALAVSSGRFATDPAPGLAADYIPPRLLTSPEEWQEMDFFQPDLHEDLQERFVTLHTRAYRGRSYFRVFYRYPGGRAALATFLREVEERGIDWKTAAQNGFITLSDETPQFPPGMEVALVQFLMTLDEQLRPAPTSIVESIRLRVFANVDGTDQPATNTGVGMDVAEYTLRRRLLFDGARHGGLDREPNDFPVYRVIFQGENAPDWGDLGRSRTLVEDCRKCHTGAGQVGSQTLFSLIHMGGFDAGAQLGVARALPAGAPSPRPARAVVFKSRHETYRRLLEFLDE